MLLVSAGNVSALTPQPQEVTETVSMISQNMAVNQTRKLKLILLGLNVDDKIICKPHIEHIKAKVAKTTAILMKLKANSGHKALDSLHNALILPYLNGVIGQYVEV